MSSSFLSLGQLDDFYELKQDWLFDKLLSKMSANVNIILSASKTWGINAYADELRFQLRERNPDMLCCLVNIKSAYKSEDFLNQFYASLYQCFPKIISKIEDPNHSMAGADWGINVLKLPPIIAQRKKKRIAIFLANAHLLLRFKDAPSFLRATRRMLRNQKGCVYCLYGIKSPHFDSIIKFPGPLSILGKAYELTQNPLGQGSAMVRKLFHVNNKNISMRTSFHISCLVNNQPHYLKLLAWHSLIRTHHSCKIEVVDQALNDLILHFSFSYYQIVECLTQKQLGFLKALADKNEQLYSKSTREKYGLGSSGTVARIKQCLENKYLIYSGQMECTFYDPIFYHWLRRQAEETALNQKTG